ncbi:MAG: hypothetical protein R3Y68_09440 [Rikenellaceae bacterium]
MGDFTKYINHLMAQGGSKEQAIKSIEILDRHILEPIKESNPAKYWHLMRSIHEMNEGCHYNEMFAIWEVEQMQHTDSEGIACKGAHWSIDKVKQIFVQHKAKLSGSPNVYDFYVGLHSWWHDNIAEDIKDFAENAEAKNIKRAVNYFFCDEDAPDGKIWRYYKGMRAECE